MLNRVIDDLRKAAPGPRPSRFGSDVVWDERRRRWIKPRKDVVGVDTRSPDTFGGTSSVLSYPEERGVIDLPGDRYRSRNEHQKAWRQLPDVESYHSLPGEVHRYYEYEYKDLNAALREGDELTPDDQRTYAGMKQSMKPVSQDYLVYRGWRNNPDFARVEVGEVIASPQFTSTTTDPHYAVQWASYNSTTGEVNQENPMWQIRVPKGAKGLMAHDYEIELTLDTYTQFRCVGVRQEMVRSRGGEGEFYMRGIYDMEVVIDE